MVISWIVQYEHNSGVSICLSVCVYVCVWLAWCDGCLCGPGLVKQRAVMDVNRLASSYCVNINHQAWMPPPHTTLLNIHNTPHQRQPPGQPQIYTHKYTLAHLLTGFPFSPLSSLFSCLSPPLFSFSLPLSHIHIWLFFGSPLSPPLYLYDPVCAPSLLTSWSLLLITSPAIASPTQMRWDQYFNVRAQTHMCACLVLCLWELKFNLESN